MGAAIFTSRDWMTSVLLHSNYPFVSTVCGISPHELTIKIIFNVFDSILIEFFAHLIGAFGNEHCAHLIVSMSDAVQPKQSVMSNVAII